MKWDYDFDVKEYRPKRSALKADCQAPGADRIKIPGVPLGNTEAFYSHDMAVPLGGSMMTTAEILDFAEGSDSY